MVDDRRGEKLLTNKPISNIKTCSYRQWTRSGNCATDLKNVDWTDRARQAIKKI